MRTPMLLLVLSAGAVQAQTPEPGLTRALAEHRARMVTALEYDVALRIPEAASEPVQGSIVIRFDLAERTQPLVLDFDPDTARVSSIANSDGAVPFELANGHIVIPAAALRQGRNELRIEFVAGDGSLNRNPDFLYTLFVPDRASNAIPLFDQPDMKAVFRLVLDVPRSWEAVANGAAEHVQTTNDRTRITFAPTQPISTYLFSFAAGRFHVESAERDGRVLRMLHRETDSASVARNSAPIFDLHAAALRWLEDYTGIPYPFGKFDFVLIPSFQYGGMEHPGAILYNAARLMLESAATQNELLGRASLIAHETAHMWFGDLVTMRWFDDVWMKEVFANFMAAKIVNPSFPEVDHELRFLLAHHPIAYGVDRTPGTHAIRQQLHNLNEAGSLYGAIIYQKAPIVMRQLETIVGEAAFRAGMREYLAAYAFGNATWTDLVTILDRLSPLNIAAWSSVWVDQAHRPTVHATMEAARGRVSQLRLHQQDPADSSRVWPQRVDVLLGWPDSTRIVPVLLDASSVAVPGVEGMPLPDLVMPDARGLGYARFQLDARTQRALLDSLHLLPDPVSRGTATLALHDAMLEGEVTPAALLHMLTSALGAEQTQLLTERYLALASAVFWRFLSPAERAAAAPSLENLIRAGLEAATTASARASWFAALRDVALTEGTVGYLRAIWAGSDSVRGLPLAERDFTALAQALAIRQVPGSDSILQHQVHRIDNPDRRARLEFILPALSPDPAVRDTFFRSLRDPRNRTHEPWVLDGLAALNHPLRAAGAEKHIRAGLELLPEIQRTGDIFFPRRWADALLAGHASPSAAQEVRAFLDHNPDLAPRLHAIVLQAADDLFRAARSVTGRSGTSDR